MIKLTNEKVDKLAVNTALVIKSVFKKDDGSITLWQNLKAYAIPRGGIPAAYAVSKHFNGLTIVDTPEQADIFIDDLIDSGATKQRYLTDYPATPFFTLIDKRHGKYEGEWVVFPWECSDEKDQSATDIVTRLLQYIGEDPKRQGLIETPVRVTKAWSHWCSGYHQNAADVLKVFEDGAENYDQMVTVKDIPFYSHCEHHLAPFFGTISISYIPDGQIIGLSKLARLADMYARRLQVQERLTSQIADALVDNLEPLGVGVIVKARHLCLESRGICQQGHHTITTALRGVVMDEAQVRAEFLSLVQ